MKKLLILGGVGDMGSFIVKDTVKFGGEIWSKITIADINEKKAKIFLSELKDPHVEFVKIDVTHHDELVSLMKNYDVVCSTIGPFYFFGPKIVRAAIEAKIPLIDICDDSGPTLEILEMDEEAKKAKIPIFLGYGWTPGLTNLLAKHAYAKLDKNSPISFNIAWAGGAADSEGFAVILHVLYAVTGKFPAFVDGKYMQVPAGRGNVRVDFPEPLGTIGIFDCGHPEPVTIPKFLPEVTGCTLKGGLTPNWNNTFAESMKHLHLTQGRRRKKILAKLVHFTEKLFATGGIAASSARVDIYGKQNGKDIHWVYCTPSIVMGELTGYPASITAQLYAQEKISGTGILPPEALPENVPAIYFEEMKKRGIEMIFDEKDPLEIFKPPEPYKLGLVSRYWLTSLIIIILVSIVSGFIFLILNLI